MVHLFLDDLSCHGPTKPKIIYLYVPVQIHLRHFHLGSPIQLFVVAVAQLLGMWASTWCTITASFSTCGNVLPQFRSLHGFTSVLPIGLASPTEYLTGTKALIFLGYKS